MEWNTQTLLTVFVGLTGFAVLLQAIVLLCIFMAAKKTATLLGKVSEDLKSTVIPLVFSTRQLMEQMKPQVMTISEGLVALTQTARKETAGVSISVSEIMARVNHQTERLDAILTNSLDAVERVGHTVESTVAQPVRQVNGLLAGLRAMIQTYRSTPGAAHGPIASSKPKPYPEDNFDI